MLVRTEVDTAVAAVAMATMGTTTTIITESTVKTILRVLNVFSLGFAGVIQHAPIHHVIIVKKPQINKIILKRSCSNIRGAY